MTTHAHPCQTLILNSIASAGAGALGTFLFTTIHPGLGAAFGVISAVSQYLSIVALACIFGTKFVSENQDAIVFSAIILSAFLTIALAAGVFSFLGIAFTFNMLGILLLSLIAGSIIIGCVNSYCCHVRVGSLPA